MKVRDDVDIPVSACVGDPMRALYAACKELNQDVVNVKDFAHVFRNFEDHFPALIDQDYSDVIYKHLGSLRFCPTAEAFNYFATMAADEWHAAGEGAYVDLVMNFLFGEHSRWFAFATELAGAFFHIHVENML